MTLSEQTVSDGAAEAHSAAPALAELTREQQLAVQRRSGDLLLAAAAGSGKTAVLVERFTQAVLTDSVAPARILAITFTDRAAGELRERLRRRLLTAGARSAARDVEAAFVGTFHSFCARILRAEPLAAGVAPDFDTLDEAQAARLRAQAFAAALPAVLGRDEDAVELLAPYEAWRLQQIVLGVYAELRSRGQQTPRLPSGPAVPDGAAAEQAAAVCALLGDLLAEFGERYGR
jgi:superfamily I DNA/RNA helicase